MAVLATGLTAAVVAASMGQSPAQALPSYASACTGCHAAGGSVMATPSSATLAPGAAYTVAIAITATTGGNSGFWISGNGVSVTGGPAAGSTQSAAMTAPAAAGTYTYTVWANQGSPPGAANSVLYSITVGAPPVVNPPVVNPPVSISHLRALSPRHGDIATKVTIRGTGFGTPGAVRFDTVPATVPSWTNTKIVVRVPAEIAVRVTRDTNDWVPIWYRHAPTVLVSVIPGSATPSSAAASNAVSFRLDSDNHHGHDFRFGRDFD
jgi:IPT/TIG domain